MLAALTAAFTAAEPDVRLDLHAATSPDQVHLLDRGDLDVGLLHHPVDASGLALGRIVATNPGVVLSRSSPLAGRTEVALAELAGRGLVLFPREAAPGRYDETLSTCEQHGFRPVRVRHAVNAEFLLGLVAAGADVAFDQGAVARKEPRVVWRPLTGTPLVWRTSVAWPRAASSGAVTRFAELATQVLSRSSGPTASPVRAGAPRPWNVVFPQRLTVPGA